MASSAGMSTKHPTTDLVNRRYTADAPNRLWVADLTQHPTDEGWLYLAIVVDVFSRRVVGWSMGERATADLFDGCPGHSFAWRVLHPLSGLSPVVFT